MLVVLYAVSRWLPAHEQLTFVFAGIAGLVTYIAVDGLSALLDAESGASEQVVRSGLAAFLVQKGTLTEYRYLEHGAFWAIIALAAIMFLQTVTPIPELVTGLIGAGFIGLSFMSSLRHNRRVATAADPRPAR